MTKRDTVVWKRLRCPQRMQRTWRQIAATPYMGLREFVIILVLQHYVGSIHSTHFEFLINPLRAELFEKTQKCLFYYFSSLRWHRLLKSFLMEDEDLFMLHNQYHCCWWPGDARSQVINSHGIDLVLPEYSCLSIRWVNLTNLFHIPSSL